MERPQAPAPEDEVRFLLSLLRIANPGERNSQPMQSLEELLPAPNNH
jgi:hypothetical protein